MSRPIAVVVCMVSSSQSGGFKSPHIHGTHVPVEERSQHQQADITRCSIQIAFNSIRGACSGRQQKPRTNAGDPGAEYRL
jgi:hypothetical protein